MSAHGGQLGLPAPAERSYKRRPYTMVPRAGVLERPPYQNKTSRSSTHHRCFTNRMGSSSQWKAGNRLSGQTSSANTFKLPRVVGHPSSHKSFRERLKVQKRQVLSDKVAVLFGWPHPLSRGLGFGSLDYHLRVRNQAFRKASGGQRKCPCRPPVSSVTTLQMAASPTSVQVPRSHLSASYDRSLRQFQKCSSAPVQYQVFRPELWWRGCSRLFRLGIPQQFRQRPVSLDQ